ncbi:MAG TPA: alpha/beta fold hydrolase [Gemmatimonadaceae bacterium]|nr:alpha/beta fold hydrolase [Gemmatimonadaceae bacterium]
MNGRPALFAFLLASLGGCKLDGFLFNPRKLQSYDLSRAVIADSLQQIVTFRSDNETLYGVLARQPGKAPRLTVLYSHGNKHHLQEYWDRVELLWKAGYDVLVYDYRGYGLSRGKSTGEETLFADARAALQYVLALPGVSPASLVLYGYSLGAAPTIELASSAVTPRAIITESAFSSGETQVRGGSVLEIPGAYLLKGAFDNVGKAPRINVPWLILHGVEDTFVDASCARTLFEKAGGPKRLFLVPAAGHSDLPWIYGTSAYTTLIRAFGVNPPRS